MTIRAFSGFQLRSLQVTDAPDTHGTTIPVISSSRLRLNARATLGNWRSSTWNTWLSVAPYGSGRMRRFPRYPSALADPRELGAIFAGGALGAAARTGLV